MNSVWKVNVKESSFAHTITVRLRIFDAMALSDRLLTISLELQPPFTYSGVPGTCSLPQRYTYQFQDLLFKKGIANFDCRLFFQQDIDWLSRQLGNLQSSVKVDWFNHLDFLWGVNSNQLLYDPLIAALPLP